MAEPLEYPLKGWPAGLQTQGRVWETSQQALRECTNFDITDTGQLVRRPGRYLLHAGAIEPNSLYGEEDILYFVESGILNAYTPHGIRPLMTVGEGPMNYARAAGVIYFTNQQTTGRIFGETATHWGLPISQQPPMLSRQDGGNLLAGTYQVALTWSTDLPNGAVEESGAMLAEEITLTASGGLVVTAFPETTEASAVNVYVSHPDGSLLFWQGAYAPTVTQVTVTDMPSGPELETQFHAPPPPGQCLCAYHARLLVGQDNAVYLTEPFYPSLVDYRESVLPYDAPITLLHPVTDGVYVGTTQDLWFVAGLDTEELTQRRVASYGVTLGTNVRVPQTAYGGLCWSERGILALGDGGEIKPLFEGRIALDGTRYSSGVSGYREARPDGQRTVVFILRRDQAVLNRTIQATTAHGLTSGQSATVS